MSISVVNTLPEEKWRHFVGEHPAGNIFHTPEMFQVFAGAQGYQPELWAVVDHNSQPLALFIPVKITLHNGPMRFFTTRSVVHGGVLYRSNYDQLPEVLQLLLCTYSQEVKDSLFTELRHQTSTEKIQVDIQKCNYEFEQHDNFLIDLAGPAEEVFKKISKSTRKNIRKAERKNDLVIEEIRDSAKLSIWYELIKKTYQRARIPLADYSLFENSFDLLHSKGMVQFLLGRVEDEYVAASVALLYKDVIYGWYRGFNREYSKYLPNDLMVWQVLKWGAENDYRVFDFGGAGKPDEKYGPRRFKSKFGGDLVSYGRNICVHAPLTLKLSQMGYQIYRQYLLKHLESSE